jgi:protein subunit release factor A
MEGQGNRPSDEQITLALINLQAMLNIDDMDKLISLLEQNDWDESKAAN